MIKLLLIGLILVVFVALFISGFISKDFPKQCGKCGRGEWCISYTGSTLFWTHHKCDGCGGVNRVWRGFWRAR